MDTLIKSTLHSEISDGRVKYVRKPNVWCGDPENGYLPGDLVDANGLADFIAQNDIVHDDPSIQELRELAAEMNTAVTNAIAGKADKVNNATSGNFAALDSNGNLTDSGHKHSDYLTSHQDISGKEDVTTIVAPINQSDATEPITTLTTQTGKYYRIDVPVETLAITLPAMNAVTSVKKVDIYFTAGNTPAVTITSADSKDIYYQDGFELEAGKTYKVNALFDGSAWVVDALTIKIPPFFAKLTLNNGEVVELEGSGELTRAMVSQYSDYLVSAEIGELCTSIGEGAFQWRSGLTNVTIPNSVTSIGKDAFLFCSGLNSINIPDSVTSIGNNAFNGCSGLTSIIIPYSVTSIGSGAFNNCSGLTSIVVDSTNTVYDSRDNCNAIINTSTNELILGCKNTVIPNTVTSIGERAFSSCSTSVTIPDSVTSIGEWAFQGCSNLQNVTIGSGVTSIDKYAFESCTGLTSIDIPDSVTSIGSGAFNNCSGLTSCTIGSGVTSIGSSAFRNCSGLTSITCNAMTAPTIKSDTFESVKSYGTLTVPSGSSGYNGWMGTGNYYLGKYGWTKVEQ